MPTTGSDCSRVRHQSPKLPQWFYSFLKRIRNQFCDVGKKTYYSVPSMSTDHKMKDELSPNKLMKTPLLKKLEKASKKLRKGLKEAEINIDGRYCIEKSMEEIQEIFNQIGFDQTTMMTVRISSTAKLLI